MLKPLEEILIIKHGALGDIVLASGHIKAIREHHPGARITCLTSKGYASLFALCPWIDEVWIDPKPKPLHLLALMKLRGLLRSRRFVRVYDLQTSTRSSSYWNLMPSPKPEWSGIGSRASHPQRGEERLSMHTIPRLTDQLRIAGISTNGTPDITWLQADITNLLLGIARFALLVPGGSAHRPEKRWPAEHYAKLATLLADKGIIPILLGTNAEQEALSLIASSDSRVINLCGKTSIPEMASLARRALFAIGNDTGPIHVIAATGCATTVLFSQASDPARTAPMGEHIRVLRETDLGRLSPETVLSSLPQA